MDIFTSEKIKEDCWQVALNQLPNQLLKMVGYQVRIVLQTITIILEKFKD
jgi:hypothetical protein